MSGLSKNISRINTRAKTPGVCFGWVEYLRKGTTGPRIQRDFQLVHLIRGDADITIEGVSHVLHAGEVALLKPGFHESFQFSKRGITQHSWCSVHPPLLRSDQIVDLRHSPFSTIISPTLVSLLNLGLKSSGKHTPKGSQFLEQLGITALLEYLHITETRLQTDSPLPEPLSKALRWMQEHFHEPIPLSTIARAVHSSPSQIIRWFRRHLGIRPARYLWDLRIQHATELIQSTGLNFSEIAERSGFKNPYHFSRKFKARHRLSPRVFRRKNWLGHTG